MSTKQWGSDAWTLFHISTVIVNRDNPYITNRVKTFLFHFWKFLPCPRCRKDAQEYLNKNSIFKLDKFTDIIRYGFDFHNFVNKKTKKNQYEYNNFLSDYNMITKDHIKKINNFTNYLRLRGNQDGITNYNLDYYRQYLKFLFNYVKIPIKIW
jgi:hypothetical protein